MHTIYGLTDFVRIRGAQMKTHVHTADYEDFVVLFHFTAEISSEAAVLGVDLARIQRAGKCAKHSTAETGNDVVDCGGVRLATETRHVQAVVGRDLTVHTEIDRFASPGNRATRKGPLRGSM